MILRWSRWLTAFAIVSLLTSFSSARMEQRPVLEVHDGNLFITNAKDRNITLQTSGMSYVTIDEIDLKSTAKAECYVRQIPQSAAQLVESWRKGEFADMQITIRQLSDTVNSIFMNGTTTSRSDTMIDSWARDRIQALKVREHPTCDVDYLEIKGGPSESSPRLEIYCNHTQPPPLISIGNEAWSHFHSDAAGQDSGFQLTYSAIPGIPGCGGVFMASSAHITSPNFAVGRYPSNLDCEWIIRLPEGERAKITFVSDTSRSDEGFELEWDSSTIGCGGDLTSASGSFSSPNYPQPYDHLAHCVWYIKISAGSYIQFTILDVELEEDIDCVHDYVEIWEGPIIGRREMDDIAKSLALRPYRQPPTLLGLYSVVISTVLVEVFIYITKPVGMNCGGRILLSKAIETADISTPNYPNSPHPYSKCSWTIIAPSGEHIKINFNRLSLRNSENCEKEYVEVRDGATDASELLQQHCSDNSFMITPTTGNYMYIHYYTDFVVPGIGFTATVSIDDICGGYRTGSRGEIQSPKYPSVYPNDLNCTWTITAPSGHTLELQFENIDLPIHFVCQNTDHVDISEQIGFNQSNVRSLGQYCGNVKPQVLQTSGNTARISFISTGRTNSGLRGFKLTFKSSQESCDGELEAMSGEFRSPGYPNSGIAGWRNCKWLIKVPEGYRIRLNITDIDLGDTQLSEIRFYNDVSQKSRIVRIINSTVPTQIFSTSNVMYVRYWSLNTAHRGFRAYYEAIAPATYGSATTNEYGTLMTQQNPVFEITSFFCNWKVSSPSSNTTSQTLAITISGFVGNSRIPTLINRCYRMPTNILIKSDERNIVQCISGNLTQDNIVIRSPSSVNRITAAKQMEYEGTVNFTMNYRWHQCGGILSGPSHTVTAPTNISSPVDCVWDAKFEGNGGIIKLSFKKINLDCSNNYILVKNAGPSSPELNKLCGSIIPEDITSTSNQFWIEYHGESSGNVFEFQLETIVRGCGGVLRGSTGYLSSPGFPAQYPNNAECEWEIAVPNGYHIGLVFVDRFHIESSTNCTNDFVQVSDWKESLVDGTSSWSELGRVCGRISPAPFNSTSNRMSILFRSNSANQADSFRAKWNLNCGGILPVAERKQYLTSPGWPNHYERNMICNYRFLAPSKSIIVEFLEFDLEGGKIELDSGPKTFRTQINSSMVSLEDPVNCQWIVRAPGNSIVKFTITTIIINRPTTITGGNQTTACDHEYLEVRDGDSLFSDLVHKYCGNISPQPFFSLSNIMFIRLVTENLLNGVGVTGRLESILSPCGDPILEIGNGTKVLTSPGFPGPYEAGLRCRWILSDPDSTEWKRETFTIHFVLLDLEYSQNCNDENLSLYKRNNQHYIGKGYGQNFIYNGIHTSHIYPGQDFPESTYSYCGNGTPHNYYSSDREVVIRFKSSQNPNARYQGFKIEYSRSNCSRNFTSPQGRILHIDSRDCWFTITAPVNHTISLYFNEFIVYGFDECIDSALQIHDGDFSPSTLRQLCGTVEPSPIFSSGNKLSLHSWSNTYMPYSRYDITYTTTDQGRGCGGKIYNYLGRFSSPLYPEPYHNASECTWEVSVPGNLKVELTFVALDLGTSQTCDTNYLEISDVELNGETSSTSKYCGGDNPDGSRSNKDTVRVKYVTTVNNTGNGWVTSFVVGRGT